MHQLVEDAAQGNHTVIQAFSNMGAFHVAYFFQELFAGTSESEERNKLTLQNSIRAIIFDSGPAPLSVSLITRGYVAYTAGLRIPLWTRLKRWLRPQAHREVRYDVPVLSWLIGCIVRALMRSPNFRRNLKNLHSSLRSMIPASTHLIYFYSDADALIPASDILSHANSQLTLPPHIAHVSCRSDLSREEQRDMAREQLEFESSQEGETAARQQRNREARKIALATKAKLAHQEMKVQSVRLHVSQPLPAAAANPEHTPSADDASALVTPLRSQLAALVAATTSVSRQLPQPVDLVGATWSAQQVRALAASGAALLRTITTVRFHASPHVQHARIYPHTYHGVVDHVIRTAVTPFMYQIPKEALPKLLQTANAFPQEGDQDSNTEVVQVEEGNKASG
jgi:hypothetical protein